MTHQIEIEILDWAKPFFDKSNRYCVAYGGRGSGKSTTIAHVLLLRAYQEKTVVVCAREFQSAIKYSVHLILKQEIERLGLSHAFTVTNEEIRCNHNGSIFFFKGVKNNIDSIKSIPSIDIMWIEEADILSNESWNVITPTIRKLDSQIYISFNPRNKDDCIYREFIHNIDFYPDAYVVKVNWRDNPFFNETLQTERLRAYYKLEPALYNHVWEGATLEHSEAQIFYNKWVVENVVESEDIYPYYGLDFGYSVDQTAAVRCFVKNNNLYITHEFYKANVEIDDIGRRCEEAIPGFKKHKIVADSARPETISFMKRQGYIIEGALKGKGSVEDGIAFIRSFDKVIIDPRCVNTIREFTMYSYKIDPNGDVTTKIVDAYNHICDALRYALESLMKRKYADYRVLSRW